MSGALPDVKLILMPAAHALVEARRNIETATKDLNDTEVWAKPNNAPSVAFHLRHIAGSIDRLLTYTRGEKLTDAQFDFLRRESEFDHSETAETLTAKAVQAVETALEVLRRTDENILFEPRFVGRQNLPTNVFGLLFHIAEHTQRHTGQIVTTARVVANYEW